MRQTRWAARTLLAAVVTVGMIGAFTTGAQAAPTAAGNDFTAPAPSGDNQGPGTELAPGQAYLGWKSAGAAGNTTPETVAPADFATADSVDGIDVSGWQENVDWASWWNQGKRFAYVKATEGTDYQNSYFDQQYGGSYDQGFIRGSYHFARPDVGGGAAQAEYFVAHGGGWSGDGKTLPGVLDIEFNPYGDTCFGLGQADLTNWIADFLNRYKELTTRDAVIYTNTSWWQQCTGNADNFGATNPLWVANYGTDSPPLPAGWSWYTFHQYTDSPLDQNRFSAGYDRLQVLATG